MFVVTGKIYSIDKLEKDSKVYYTLVLKKKHRDKDLTLFFSFYKNDLIKQYECRFFEEGDQVKLKFTVNSREYNSKFYTNLYIDKIVVQKKKELKVSKMFKNNMKIPFDSL